MIDNLHNSTVKVPLQTIAQHKNSTVDLLRLDTIHPIISGNKWFKLKFHLKNATDCKSNGLISYGGYWSNHLVSIAYAGYLLNISTIGVINGAAISQEKYSQTLQDCCRYGMRLLFIGRSEYARRNEAGCINKLRDQFPGYYIIPEGAADTIGVLGAGTISELVDDYPSYTDICCSVGSGTMMAGLIAASSILQLVHGFAAFKSTAPIAPMIKNLLPLSHQLANFNIISNYHFGGFSKVTPELVQFMNDFYSATQIPTDRVYSAKLIAGVLDLFDKGYFKEDAKILAIHCGGLQGNLSFPYGTLQF